MPSAQYARRIAQGMDIEMSHTVSSAKRAEREGGFSFECFDYSGNLFRADGGFATQAEAVAAAEMAEREMTMAMNAGPAIDCNLTDDELLKELTGI